MTVFLEKGCRPVLGGCWTVAIGCWSAVTGCWLFVTGGGLLAAGWLLFRTKKSNLTDEKKHG